MPKITNIQPLQRHKLLDGKQLKIWIRTYLETKELATVKELSTTQDICELKMTRKLTARLNRLKLSNFVRSVPEEFHKNRQLFH